MTISLTTHFQAIGRLYPHPPDPVSYPTPLRRCPDQAGRRRGLLPLPDSNSIGRE